MRACHAYTRALVAHTEEIIRAQSDQKLVAHGLALPPRRAVWVLRLGYFVAECAHQGVHLSLHRILGRHSCRRPGRQVTALLSSIPGLRCTRSQGFQDWLARQTDIMVARNALIALAVLALVAPGPVAFSYPPRAHSVRSGPRRGRQTSAKASVSAALSALLRRGVG